MSVDANSIVLIVVAALNAYTAWRMNALEKNTNSKMDTLLRTTAKASLAEGKAEGLEQGRSEDRK